MRGREEAVHIEINVDIDQVKLGVAAVLKSAGQEEHIYFSNLGYSRSKKGYVLFLYAAKLLSMDEVLLLQKRLSQIEVISFKEIVIKQPAELLQQTPGALTQTVKEFMVKEEPALVPFVQQSDAVMEDGLLTVMFGHAMAPNIAKRLDIDKRIEAFLLEVYDLQLRVKEFAVMEMDKPAAKENGISALFENHIVKEPTPAFAPSKKVMTQRMATPAEAKKPSGGGFPKRRRKAKIENMEVTPIAELVPEEEVLIAGDVISIDIFVSKDGKTTIATVSLTDYTSSVRCRKFFRDAGRDVDLGIQVGDHAHILGRYIYNTYNREYAINIADIAKADKEMRMDEAEEKRVELHLHTNMSAQDGMSGAADYINRAAEWGHSAIAITDHGVVQAFPEAANAAKAHPDLKVIFGMEAYLVDVPNKIYTGEDRPFDDTEFIVFDIETTGLSKEINEIIEIGAVRVKNGQVLDQFQSFVRPQIPVPYEITKLTGITQQMVQDAPDTQTVLRDFWAFAQDAPLVAHNASFDTGFVFGASRKYGMEVHSDVVDTLLIARVHLRQLKSKALNRLAKHYGFPLEHHRAVNDAMCTAQIFYAMLNEIKQQGFTKLSELNFLADTAVLVKSAPRPNHAILLCKNKTGLVNLYKLVSLSHLQYFYSRPRTPKNELARHREGLIIGSGCEQGELYQAVLQKEPQARLEQIASFYDFLEIQPHGNNDFMIRNGRVSGLDELSEINRTIVELGKKLNIPVVATGDVHFLEPHDEHYRRVLMETSGFKDADNQAPLYLKTTEEMLADFAYLGEDVAREVVITNPAAIAAQIEEIDLFPGETAMPTIENADVEIREAAMQKMHAMYGDPLPEHIAVRLEKELGSIIKHGYAVLYWISMKLVAKSMSDGYMVGSRGSVGSSLAAFAMEISEVNPLPPHYLCPNCQHSDFDVDKSAYGCGVDLPEAVCPHCGTPYIADGFDIPFEVFLGLNAEKVPDIDLNFSGEYRARANKYIEELFGEDFVFRAGTISTIKENTAIGLVRKFMEMHEQEPSGAEIERLAHGLTGVKKTTGQHPGGLVIVPKDREIYEFTPIQRPADKMDADTVTTHFDFNSMHDILIKLDILGHDNPTILKMLHDMTGVDPLDIPLNDHETLSLFTSTKALGYAPEQMRGVEFGVLGVPEFGTKPTMRILKQTMPTTMSELVRISGLSHGTDVWKGNAEDLILSGVTTLSGAICTRDDIMLSLVDKGVEHQRAFFIMESVRKGMWARGKDKNQSEHEAAMKAANVPEWFIESCRKIQYMFPKAHAAAYVVNAFRIAYYKVHYPIAFYAAEFTIRKEDFNAEIILAGEGAISAELDRLQSLGMKQTMTEKNAAVVLELALEMYIRGFGFLAPDLKKSKGTRFIVEGNNLRLPFVALPMLGEKAAELMEEKCGHMEFNSIEELKKECKLSGTVVDLMASMGCLGNLPQKAQLTIFEAYGLS